MFERLNKLSNVCSLSYNKIFETHNEQLAQGKTLLAQKKKRNYRHGNGRILTSLCTLVND